MSGPGRTYEELRRVAVRAATVGQELVARWVRQGTDLAMEKKGQRDYVTGADHAAENAIVEVLRRDTPNIPIVAEESGGAHHECMWIVDPIDGTTNLLRGFPVVGVSVGLIDAGVPVAGAVAAPLIGGVWSASKGGGAFDSQSRRLAVAAGDGDGITATGLPYWRPQEFPRYMDALPLAVDAFEDLRNIGAASLALTYVARGVFDGYFELGLSLWDVAAGIVLVREAGGIVSDWSGDERASFEDGEILAGSRRWHDRMMCVVQHGAQSRVLPNGTDSKSPTMGGPPRK
jgi:myo-inositol-1(or 4)-monophosphatase